MDRREWAAMVKDAKAKLQALDSYWKKKIRLSVK